MPPRISGDPVCPDFEIRAHPPSVIWPTRSKPVHGGRGRKTSFGWIRLAYTRPGVG